MNAIALTATVRCRHGIALVGGFVDSDVEHDGTRLRHGQSLACDDEQAKAHKRAQARELQRQEQARSDARRASDESTYTPPMRGSPGSWRTGRRSAATTP